MVEASRRLTEADQPPIISLPFSFHVELSLRCELVTAQELRLRIYVPFNLMLVPHAFNSRDMLNSITYYSAQARQLELKKLLKYSASASMMTDNSDV
jgi:hypothetical protein